ncbi:alkaline phosphatase D family protein [Mycobacterium hubeiense]|uniref:alkaline phosphatase D family protein n=1 Tax=Mycobacterium hubeiense TaxID=1867256 RepID=UPI000C7EB950|nr:alkaline phosphatase D family protein [Mycobacterium sp. QGD 101]
MSVRRRELLKAAVALAALPVAGFTHSAKDPFTLGVASGDPSPDGMVIWTRLAPNPLADDGLGGMPSRAVDVEWEVAADERFTRVERRGTTTATPQSGHTIHVELTGLRPGAEYFYRFRAHGHLSPPGRTRTAPAPRATDPLTICVASCSNYEQGFFTAYRGLAEEHPDLVVHLGDYQYEYAAGTSGNVRHHVGPETVTLANYRQRYAQYKTDPDLQAAHAAAPWLPVFDDHELADNWADEVPGKPQPAFLDRRAAALRAYYENMPLRRASLPRGIDMGIFRRVHWGSLATFHMLDTRQYRDDQPCADEISDCPERDDKARSLLGAQQERWLLNGFRQLHARWDLLGQQVFFAPLKTPRGFNPDAWDGYAANRDRIVAGMRDVRNAVVLTGDVHSHWAAEVRADDTPVATELVTTSISSGGDGSGDDDAVPADNPHIHYHSNRRGYLRARITADELRADFRELPFVSRPGAPVHTGASFTVPDQGHLSGGARSAGSPWAFANTRPSATRGR